MRRINGVRRRRVIGLLAALVLPLAALAGGVQAAQPAAASTAPWHDANPSIAVQGNGDQFVFWKGTNDGLWEAFNNGSWQGPIEIPNMGPLGTSPTVAVSITTEDQAVVWRGTDDNLWFACWNGSSWNGPDNLHMGQIGSRPDIAASTDGGFVLVWKGTNSALWYAINDDPNSACSGNSSGWTAPASPGEGPLGSAPSATMMNGTLEVTWTGTSPYDLWYYNLGSGKNNNLGQGPLDSAPSLLSPLGNSVDLAFWAGTNGGLWATQWRYLALTNSLNVQPPGEIFLPDGNSMGPLGSAPSAAFTEGTYYVVWQGQDNGLWEASDYLGPSGGWTLTEIPGMGPL
jgi:hypothetical protein